MIVQKNVRKKNETANKIKEELYDIMMPRIITLFVALDTGAKAKI